MIGTKSYSDAMHEYVKLLLELHHLYLAGKNESDEADELRDRMDGPWRDMTAHEISITDGLSADLYSIGKKRRNYTEKKADEITQLIGQYVNKHDWPQILELARKYELNFDQQDVSYLRGACWSQLGFPFVANEFYQDMIGLGPVTVVQESAYLGSLIDANEFDRGLVHAREFNDNTHPFLWMQYGLLLSSKAIAVEGVSDSEALQLAIRIGLHALRLASKTPMEAASKIGISPEVWLDMLIQTELKLSLMYLLVGDFVSSLSHVESILRTDPDFVEALLVKNHIVANKSNERSRNRIVGKWIARQEKSQFQTSGMILDFGGTLLNTVQSASTFN